MALPYSQCCVDAANSALMPLRLVASARRTGLQSDFDASPLLEPRDGRGDVPALICPRLPCVTSAAADKFAPAKILQQGPRECLGGWGRHPRQLCVWLVHGAVWQEGLVGGC